MSSQQSDGKETREDPVVTYANLVTRGWKTKPSELSKTREGRRELREYVKAAREAYERSLTQCGDPVSLQMGIDFLWEETANRHFRAANSRPLKLFPFDVDTITSPYRNDPWVTDRGVFEYIIDTRMTPKETFAGDPDGLALHAAYRNAWVQDRLNALTFSSTVYYMYREIQMERIVTLEAEWRTHGIVSDETDRWENEIPTSVVPSDVQDLLEDGDAYKRRKLAHDSIIPGTELFFGFPLGSKFPVTSACQSVAMREEQIVTLKQKIEDLQKNKRNFELMRGLANLGNDYLRYKQSSKRSSVKDVLKSNPPNCSSLPKEIKVSCSDLEAMRLNYSLLSKEPPPSEMNAVRKTSAEGIDETQWEEMKKCIAELSDAYNEKYQLNR